MNDIIAFSRTSTARILVLGISVVQTLVQHLGGCHVDVRLLFAVTHVRPCSEHLTHRIPVPQLRHWTTRNNAQTAGQRPTIILHPYRRWCHRVVTGMSLGAMTTVRNKRGGGHITQVDSVNFLLGKTECCKFMLFNLRLELSSVVERIQCVYLRTYCITSSVWWCTMILEADLVKICCKFKKRTLQQTLSEVWQRPLTRDIRRCEVVCGLYPHFASSCLGWRCHWINHRARTEQTLLL